MSETYIKLPDDATNTGKKLRHQENTVSGQTVQQQVVTLAGRDGTLLDHQGTSGLGVQLLNHSGASSAAYRNLDETLVGGAATALLALFITNNQGAAAYVQIFDDDDTGGPTLGTTDPILEILVAANSQLVVPLPAAGFPVTSGVVLASTTTSRGSTGSNDGVHVYIVKR